LSIQHPISSANAETVNPTWLTQLKPGQHRILGMDIGTKTIGLARCAPDWTIVTPLVTVKRGKNWAADLQALNKELAEYPVQAVIIGLPLNMDGSEGPRAQSTRQIAANLAEARPAWLQAPALIGFWDERLSTAAVTRFMIDVQDTSRAKRAEIVDALAAHHILQGAMDYLNNQRER
jgi:putative Holliday junction resolvase